MVVTLDNKINFKSLSVIFAIAIGIFVSLNVLDEEITSLIVFPISVILSLGVAITGFIIAKQNSSQVSGRSFFVLGLGYLSYTIAEVTYYSLELLGFEAYPSIADVFFFGLYPLVAIHLIMNIRFFFKKKLSKIQKVWLAAIPVTFVMIYAIISIEELDGFSFDFWYGLIFILGAATILSLSILGVVIFKKGYYGIPWLLLSVGILANAIGDVWYYHLEVFDLFSDSHVVNVIWHCSNMVMIYALLKHRL